MSEELTTLGEWLVRCTTAQIQLDASCQKGLGLLVQKLQRSIKAIEMLEKRRIYKFVNKPKANVCWYCRCVGGMGNSKFTRRDGRYFSRAGKAALTDSPRAKAKGNPEE